MGFSTKMKVELREVLLSNNLVLCLHVLKSSSLLLSVAPSGLNMIKYFSLKHIWQDLVVGLKPFPLAMMGHSRM